MGGQPWLITFSGMAEVLGAHQHRIAKGLAYNLRPAVGYAQRERTWLLVKFVLAEHL